jgi:hypothetical protein
MSSPAETVARVESFLAHPFPSVSRQTDGRYAVCFDRDGVRIVLTLDDQGLYRLAQACAGAMPPLEPARARPEVNAYYRQTLSWLGRSTEADIQALMRIVGSSDWVNMLWFMKDRALIDLYLRANAPALRELLMRDLLARWSGKDPDACLEFEARMGQKAVRMINRAAQELAEHGEL